jgi:anti-anti-sigma factor
MALTIVPPTNPDGHALPSAVTLPEVNAKGTCSVVALRGEWDIGARPMLSDVVSRVIAFAVGDVVIDLAGATFIDAAAFRVFATAQQLLDDQDRRLTFRSPTQVAAQVLQTFGLTDLIETETDPPLRAWPD